MNTLKRDYYQNVIMNGLKPLVITAAVLAVPVAVAIYATNIAQTFVGSVGLAFRIFS